MYAPLFYNLSVSPHLAGTTFAHSVTGQSGYKHSPFAQSKSVDVVLDTTTDGKKKKNAFAVVVNGKKVPISGGRKGGFAQIQKAVYAVRPDLLQAALAKFSTLLKSTGVHYKVVGKGEGGRKSRQQKPVA